VFGLVTGTLTYDDFKRVDMVIEAAIEVRTPRAQHQSRDWLRNLSVAW